MDISTLLKRLLATVERGLFRYQVKAGLILCVTAEEDPPPADPAAASEEDSPPADPAAASEEDPPPADDPDEVVVTIGEESPSPEEEEAAHAPEWVRELRKSHRELTRENRELKAKLTAAPAETKPAEVGKKPTLEDCDFDAERFEAELSAWHERKRAAEAAAAAKEAETQAQQKAWQAKLDAYNSAKAGLKVKDADEAEAAAAEVLSVVQQGIIIKGASNPALVIVALGKNPKKAKELAAIADPVEFAFAVAKLEEQLKVTPRKAPPPEKTVAAGTGSTAGTVDSQLDRLRAEAAKTGDYSKVAEYKRKLRKSA